MMKRVVTWVLCAVLFSINMSAQVEQEIIDHKGDRYVINVEALKPDKEMTLMDVLQTCPELLSDNGRRLNADYEIRVDNVVLAMDDETVLEALKASEINTIEIYLSTSVTIGGAGRGGTIDIYLKEQVDGSASGKLLLEGSTQGNGKAYADIVKKTGNVTVRGYALTNLKYAKGTFTDFGGFSLRQGIENVHLNLDWNISENDNLKIKLFQNFLDSKYKMEISKESVVTMPELQRYWGGVVSYTHTLNDQGATVFAEFGADYLNATIEESKQRDNYTYFFAETNIPCLNQDLNILAGWEIDYYNMWTVGYDRQQIVYNDPYLQFDYTKGPWVLTLGDRLRIINYWHRTYNTDDTSLWNGKRMEHSYLASVGYRAGRHFIQGLFSHDYITPLIYSFYNYDEDIQRRSYKTDIPTCMVYNAEARYTYQQADLVVNGGALHTWGKNSPVADEQYTGVRTSLTWRKECLRLTAGADYYHGYVSGPDYGIDKHDNFFNLRLLSTLLLDGGLRISSCLLYNSRQDLLVETPAHLYASVKISKDLGRHCTLSADFHDLAGSPRMASSLMGSPYDNRAVTLGFSYRY
ncbi:MAG: hypothetical protein J6W43_06300 [Prevotella sp.]|nr:hypothetical protein [Prevotella sp.]